jgi:lipid-binding SYLF domain-containing protein
MSYLRYSPDLLSSAKKNFQAVVLNEVKNRIERKGKKQMKKNRWIAFVLPAIILLSANLSAVPAWSADKDEIQQEKADIRKSSKETLNNLYKLQPSAKKAISKAAGYAVFNNFGMKILVAGSGTGQGIAIDNKSKKETFMKMVEVQAGLGFGIKKFRLVWVFEKQKDLNDFINSGWEFGAQASASAKMGDQGTGLSGAMSVKPGVWIYQLNDDGLAIEFTGKGTKYYKDDDLNQ